MMSTTARGRLGRSRPKGAPKCPAFAGPDLRPRAPMPRFTDRFIAALKAAPSRAEHVDSACKGLTIRVAPSGKKSWAYRYKRDGETVRITLGEYPAMTLAEATVAANKRRIDLLEGRNTKAERQKEVIE